MLFKEVTKVHVKNYMRSLIAWLKHRWDFPILLNGRHSLMLYKCVIINNTHS